MPDQNHQHEENWSAAGMVGMFDAVHRQRDRKRYRRAVLLWTLTVTICLGVPLWLTWNKVQDARRQFLVEEFDNRRPAIAKLTMTNPVINQSVQTARELRSSAHTKRSSEAIADLREAIALVDQAHDVDLNTKRIRDILNPTGITLTETQWFDSSDYIQSRHKELLSQRDQVAELLGAGQVKQAEALLAKLLVGVGNLTRDNVQAMRTSLVRQAWVRLQTSVPQRLLSKPAWEAINSVGKVASDGWDNGDWDGANKLYARAIERAQQFLDSALDPEEKAELLQSDADALARLETEKADLQRDVSRLEQQITKHNQQLAALISERQTAQAQVKTLTAERDRLETDSHEQTAELAQLRPLKKRLAETTTALESAQQQVAELSEAKQAAEESLETTKTQLAARVAEVEALLTATDSGNTNSPIIQVTAALAAIESQLAADIKRKDVQAAAELARERLADALEQYDEAVQQKQEALKKYQPTGRTVRGIEATISQAEATLARILKVLDEPLAAQYDQLQAVIAAAEANYNEVIKDALPETEGPRKLKTRIDSLKAEQAKLAAPHARHSGEKSPSSSELVSLCRQQVDELLAQRRKAEFARLLASGKVPTAAEIDFVPISPGTFMMGSNDSEADDDEQPIHEVTITKPFFAGKYEVTIGQILTWLNSRGVSFQEEWIELESDYCPIKKSGSRFVLNSSSKFGESEQQPMVEISWYGAKAFCDWCSQQDSKYNYRLPTEAEWEYMARAGSTTRYPWGDSVTTSQANISGGPGKTIKVGSYRPNAWGLYDPIGNVQEWCEDAYDSDFYGTSAARQPDPLNRSGSSRVLRGGSWVNSAFNARSASRSLTPVSRLNYLGFRVVAE